MRILVVSPSFFPTRSGIAKVTFELATGLSRRGHAVAVFTNRGRHEPACEEIFGVAVCRFRVKGRGWFGTGYRGEIEEFRRLLVEQPADVLLCVAWEHWATDLALETPLPDRVVVVASHGTSFDYRPNGMVGFVRWLAYRHKRNIFVRQIAACDHVVLLSDQNAGSRFGDKAHFDAVGFSNWSVIPNGSEERNVGHATRGWRARLGISSDRFVILCVSNYCEGKDQERALKLFRSAELENGVLVCIGSQANRYSRRLQRLVSEAGVCAHILAEVSDDDLSAAYTEADLFLFTSRTEVQPLVLLDAMRAGLPFVSTDVGCVSELPGGVVASTDGDLVLAVLRLAADTRLRSDLGAAGRAACAKVFCWNACLDQYEALFRQLRLSKNEHPCFVD